MANYLKNNVAESDFPAVYVLQMPGALLCKILKCSAECSLSTFDSLIGIYLPRQCHHKTNQYSVSAEINLPHKIPSHEKSLNMTQASLHSARSTWLRKKKCVLAPPNHRNSTFQPFPSLLALLLQIFLAHCSSKWRIDYPGETWRIFKGSCILMIVMSSSLNSKDTCSNATHEKSSQQTEKQRRTSLAW